MIDHAQRIAAPTPSDAQALLLRLRDLRVTFGGGPTAVEAVRGVSLDLGHGEAVGIVGESGSGKSTLAAAIMNLVPGGHISGGSLVFGGQDLTSLDERGWRALRGKRIAMVFQEAATALNPVVSVGAHLKESLLLNAGMRGRSAERRAAEILDEVGISDIKRRLRQFPHELSGGMRQRVLLAVALAGEPDLLIADEPTTALDVTVQAQILELLSEQRRQRRMALILISHSLPVVSNVVDRVVVMYGGLFMETAPVDEIFQHPRHPYSAALLASSPDVDRESELRPISGAPPVAGAIEPGCVFAPRCSYAQTGCRATQPPLSLVAARHELACFVDPFRPSNSS